MIKKSPNEQLYFRILRFIYWSISSYINIQHHRQWL